MNGYNFKAARTRRDLLVRIYRNLKNKHADNGTWSWWLLGEIKDIDQEIEAAYLGVNAKMTTVTSSGHPVMKLENIINPIVPAWASGGKSQYQIYEKGI